MGRRFVSVSTMRAIWCFLCFRFVLAQAHLVLALDSFNKILIDL